MCGICGQVALNPVEVLNPSLVKSMMQTIHHRGPDDEGMYVHQRAILGHKRLSIIDLGRGKQPISNEDGTVWVVFNGEIYNYRELRAQLISRGHVFKTETDTEVIIHLYEEYNEDCLLKLRGMFGFAIWDERKEKLLLARDRVGIKPVYYTANSQRLLFASEIKALVADPSVRRDIDPEGIDQYLTFMYMPGEKTLFKDVLKLAAGHYLVAQRGNIQVRRYWDLEFDGHAKNGSFESARSELVSLIGETVRDHMISDVPVGVLLSGGVDSTALLSFVVQESDKEVETFTVGFDDKSFADERPFAKLAAETYKSKHHELTISAQQFMDFLPKYVWHMEEPVCEPPAVALYYISKLASQHVKVLLSGEGGDEAFGGYQNYRNLMWMERAKRLGWPVTGALSSVLGYVGDRWEIEKAKRYSFLMRTPLEDYYYGRTWNPLSPFNSLRATTQTDASSPASKLVRDLLARVGKEDVLNKMLYVDTKTWLPDDLLVKADKMTMANSVELRVPFLDHRVLEFAARLPESAKVHGLTTKYILKKAFHGRIPAEILNRPKTGFPVPYVEWLQGELRGPIWEILRDRKTMERGYFERKAIEKLLADAEKKGNCAPEIFSLLTLELWHRGFADWELSG